MRARCLALLLLVSWAPFAARGQTAAGAGEEKNASRNTLGEISGVVNRYARLDQYDTLTNTGLITGRDALLCNELVLVIQLVGAQLSRTADTTFGEMLGLGQTGQFEFTRVRDVTSTTLSFSPPLQKTYDFTGTVVIVSVPQYRFARVIGDIHAPPFDGVTGGVIALIADTLQMDADIDASGAGFAGGQRSCTRDTVDVTAVAVNPLDCTAGSKGSGIGYLSPADAAGRGRAANGGGGGNALGAGGGGGGNGGDGGQGGWQRSGTDILDVGGRGGSPLPPGPGSDPRLFLGGGGGGGHQSNGTGTPGARGGGIVLLAARVLIARSHKIFADGLDVLTVAGADGAGGGGAGGTVCIAANTIVDPLYVSARGGKGGDVDNGASGALCHGPGGGGSGGVLRHSGPLLPPQVIPILAGGTPGLNILNPSPCLDSTYGARRGGDGLAVAGFAIPPIGGPETLLSVALPDTLRICPDSCIDLEAAIAGGIPPYVAAWSPAAQLSSPASPRTRACPDATTTYTLTARDSLGCAATAQVTVLVHPRVAPVIARDEDTLIALPPGMRYTWYFEGTEIAGETGQRITVRTFGTYALLVTPPTGCAVRSADLDVQRAPLVVTLADPAQICPDSCARLAPAVTGGAKPYSYQWFPSAGLSSSTDASPLACPAATTVYTLTVTDSVGMTTVATVAVRVRPRLLPTIDRAGNTLTAQPGGLSYRWRRDGVIIPGATGRQHNATVSGLYTVEVRSAQGCAELSPPEDVRIVLAVVLPNEQSVCPDSCVRLQPRITGGRPPYTFQWTPAEGLGNPADSTPVACPDVDRTYLLTVTDVDSVRTSAAVTVFVHPRVDPVLVQVGDTLVSQTAGASYRWFRDSTLLPGESKKWMIPRIPGRYAVEVTSAKGCTGRSSFADVTITTLLLVMPDSQRICPDSCVLLQPFFAGGTRPYTFSWSPPGPLRSPNDSVTIACPTSTTTFTLTITDGGGMSRSGDITVAVSARVFPTIFQFGDTLLAAPSGLSYQWFRNGAPIPGETSQSLHARISGRYTVEARGAGGCPALSPPVDAVVALVTALADTARVCPDSCVTLRPTIRGGTPPYTYAWFPPSSLTAPSDSTPVACPSSTTAYTLTVTDATSVTSTASTVVAVYPKVFPSITRSGDTLIATPPNLSYQWYRDAAPLAGATGDRLVLSDIGSYTVAVRTADGCPERSPALDVPRVPLTASIQAGALRLCPDSCARVSPRVGGGFAPYTYQWSPAAHVSDPAALSPVLCPDANEQYTLLVRDARGDTVTSRLDVIVLPRTFPTLLQRGDTLIAQPPGLAYRWFLDGVELPGVTAGSHVVLVSGRYAIETRTPEGCPALSPPLDVTVVRLVVTASLECPPRALVEAGERVTLLARIALPAGFASTGINGVTAWMHARGDVLAPANPQAIAVTRAGTLQSMRVPRDVTSASGSDMLVPLDFIAALGDTACTRVVLDSLTWRGGAVQVRIASASCEICVKVCDDGGPRLLDGSGRATLAQNHPNPFNASTVVAYTLIERGPVRLAAFDRLGREIAVLDEGFREPGEYRAVFDGSTLPSGVYTVLLITPTMRMQRTMVLMK